MPTVAFKTRIRAQSECYALTLDVQHRLVAGTLSNALEIRSSRPLDELNIYGASSIAISLSGKLDATTISAEKIASSQVADHLVDYFRTNANELGVTAVSDVYVDEKNNTPILMLTLSQCSKTRLDCLPVHLTLVGVDLTYNWKAESSQTTLGKKDIQGNNHPFSLRLSLPFVTLLDNVIGRFVTWQLVRRYPLIFGSWCKQLYTETTYFSPIFSSIMQILQRSPHPDFQDRCRQLFKFMRSQTAEISAVQSRAVSAYMPDVELPALEPTDLEAFFSTMERVYRCGLRIPQFKGLSRVPCRSDEDDDELSQDHRQPAHDPSLHDDAVWAGPEVLNHSAKLLGADSVPSSLSGTRVLTGCYADIEPSERRDFCQWSKKGVFEQEPLDEASQAHPTKTASLYEDHLQTDSESNFLWENVEDWAQEETPSSMIGSPDLKSQMPGILEDCLLLDLSAEQPFQSLCWNFQHNQSHDHFFQPPTGRVSPSIFEVEAVLTPLECQTHDYSFSQEASTLLRGKERFFFQMSATNDLVEPNNLPAHMTTSNDIDIDIISDEEIKSDVCETDVFGIRHQDPPFNDTTIPSQDYLQGPMEWNIHPLPNIMEEDVEDPFLMLDFL